MSATDSLYVMMFVSGFLGGFGHCLGMCGPIVAMYSLHLREGVSAPRNLKPKGVLNWMPHLLYNLGRVTTYSIIGGIMGVTGSFAVVVRPTESIRNLILGGVGMLMIVMGLAAGGWLPYLKRPGGANRFTERGAGIVRFISGIKAVGAYFPMGLVLGFLPCGLLYTAFIAAAGVGAETGSRPEAFLRGMSVLFVFGLGTSLALFTLGQFVSMNAEWLRNKLYRGAAVLMIIVGVIFLYRSVR